jgi:hypothetical protein
MIVYYQKNVWDQLHIPKALLNEMSSGQRFFFHPRSI